MDGLNEKLTHKSGDNNKQERLVAVFGSEQALATVRIVLALLLFTAFSRHLWPEQRGSIALAAFIGFIGLACFSGFRYVQYLRQQRS